MTSVYESIAGGYGLKATVPNDVRMLQQIAWDIYRHDYQDYVVQTLRNRLKPKTAEMYEPYCVPVQNPLVRIARLLSVSYTVPCYRTSTEDEVDQAVRKHAPDIDAVMGETEVLKNTCADAFVVPYWDEAAGRVRSNLYPPHLWEVQYSQDGSIEYYEHDRQVRYYVDGSIQRRVENARGGTEWGEREALFLACPVAWFRLRPYGVETWSTYSIRDLIAGTIEIGVSEALNGLGEYYRSFKQVFLDDQLTDGQAKVVASSFEIAPDVLLRNRVNTVELSDPNNPHYDYIRKKISDLAATRGISSDMYYSRDAATFATVSISPELRKIWRETTKYQAEPERDYLRAVTAVLVKYAGVSPSAVDLEWSVDYREPTPEQADRNAGLDVLKKGIELGVDSPIDFILRNDRDVVTRAEALDQAERNAKDRYAIGMLMRQFNIPLDPTDPGKTPQENGALGGQISAEMRGKYDGANGPTITPSDI
jgi:hypothetical protein